MMRLLALIVAVGLAGVILAMAALDLADAIPPQPIPSPWPAPPRAS